MKYYSTQKQSPDVTLREALLKGLAPDRGLYMPYSIPTFDKNIFNLKSFTDVAYSLAELLTDNEIPHSDLSKITDDAFDFSVPVRHINDSIYALELYHGPTAAFKDFGARFMARTMSYFLGSKKLTILVATSGDTGSAVAKGFYGLPNIDVVILYPKGKVSLLQEKQLTTLGGNITALEIDGTFDQCQFLVKEAFMDEEVCKNIPLSSANSINIGRLYPQSFYYVWAAMQLEQKQPPLFCIPSGNFGNLTGGLIAKKMGMPVKGFIAATNINDTVPQYLSSGVYKAKPSIQTYSNAMDVGDPSNFARLKELYPDNISMSKDIFGYSINDNETLAVMKDVYEKHKYILDPHGAVGYKAIMKYREETGDASTPVILLETAHPAKFGDVIKKAIGIDPEIPESLKGYIDAKKVSIELSADYKDFKSYLKTRF